MGKHRVLVLSVTDSNSCWFAESALWARVYTAVSPEGHEHNTMQVSNLSQILGFITAIQIVSSERWITAWILQILLLCVLLSYPETASLSNTGDAFEYPGVINPTKC